MVAIARFFENYAPASHITPASQISLFLPLLFFFLISLSSSSLVLRGGVPITPNAQDAPRAIGMCLNAASGNARRYFDISEVPDAQCPPILAM
jgi:hypothetical protein